MVAGASHSALAVATPDNGVHPNLTPPEGRSTTFVES
jgi:hypothetical protein